MERSLVKKMGLLSSLVLSLFLVTATIDTNRAHASTVNLQSPNGTQVAWWGGGWGYHHGYNGYYRGGNRCWRNCWINRWGHRNCNTRCRY